MLAGHTHGGQVIPGAFLADIRYPLTKGHCEIDGANYLVSQGTGSFGPWMRFWINQRHPVHQADSGSSVALILLSER
jgi:predicted MPP superfamily phosphohydrolase